MERALEEVLAHVFPGGVREVAPLAGGLTNDSYRVETARGRVVLRTWREDAGLLAVDREAEQANARRAHRAGVGPAVLGWFPECNAMLVAWVDGTTLTPAALRSGAHLGRIAAACRRLHAGPRFAGDFDMFAVQERYRQVVAEHGFRLPEGYDELAAPLAAAREALAVHAGPSVPCHNDLLAENLMVSAGRVVLVDFEYGGNNDPWFELGNLWSESALSLPQLEELLAAYAGGPARRHEVARARLWGLVSLWGWTLWGVIQAGSSPLAFDFRGWALEKHARAVATVAGPGFGGLLDEARRPD